MTSETRLAIIDDLIKNGHALLTKPYNSPAPKLWRDDVVRFLEDVYDSRLVEIFNESFSSDRIIMHGEQQERYEEEIQNALEFLEGLKLKHPPEKPFTPLGRMLELEKKYHGNGQHKPSQHNSTTTNYYIDHLGALHSGSGDIVQNISVKDVLLKLSEEIQEKAPESPEKMSILHSLASLTQNPTYANIAGILVTTLISSIINPAKFS